MNDRCESCGDDGPDLVTVQRVYVEFDETHRPVGHRLADEFETWCAICRVSYPHEAVGADHDADPALEPGPGGLRDGGLRDGGLRTGGLRTGGFCHRPPRATWRVG